MQIGEKIRSLRLSKLMTQADLAGDQITRNMLCQIERGAALPSLQTAIYLAGRLNVPVGLLLAEKGEELSYRKMTEMKNVRRAFADGDFVGCLAMLDTAFGDAEDDELSLLRAECEYGTARERFEAGHLRAAAAAFDRALTAAAGTVYDTSWLRARTAVYFRYLSGISPTLSSDVLEETELSAARALGDEFCEYFLAWDALENGRMGEVAHYLATHEGSLYAARITALSLMRENRYAEAQEKYEKLLSHEDLVIGGLMYEVFGDMELCCRKNDDYKRAYEFSSSRIGLLERLLGDV